MYLKSRRVSDNQNELTIANSQKYCIFIKAALHEPTRQPVASPDPRGCQVGLCRAGAVRSARRVSPSVTSPSSLQSADGWQWRADLMAIETANIALELT